MGHWHGLPGEVGGVSSLETFKAMLIEAQSSWFGALQPCLQQGSWNWVCFKVSSNPSYSWYSFFSSATTSCFSVCRNQGFVWQLSSYSWIFKTWKQWMDYSSIHEQVSVFLICVVLFPSINLPPRLADVRLPMIPHGPICYFSSRVCLNFGRCISAGLQLNIKS